MVVVAPGMTRSSVRSLPGSRMWSCGTWTGCTGGPRELEDLIALVEQHPVRIEAVRGGGMNLNTVEGG